jgi:hypothetical protein
MFDSSALGAMNVSRANMPPAPIEGSCAASPIATSFAPVYSTTSVSRLRRSVSAIPASSK